MIHAVAVLALLVMPSQPGQKLPDLLDTAVKAGDFDTFVTAIHAAGLSDLLRNSAPLTILAPTDEAFEALPAALLNDLLLPRNQPALSELLRAHIIPDARSAAALLEGRDAPTLRGSRVSFSLSDGRLRAGEAQVMSNDVETSNGVIHVVDQVLIPEGFAVPPKAQSPVELIELAIRSGAALFNNGDREACAAIYELTARALVLLGDDLVDGESKKRLNEVLRAADREPSPSQQAWALRGGLDFVWQRLHTDATPQDGRSDGVTLFDFKWYGEPASAAWLTVNDNVMGGISQGGIKKHTDDTILFSGALSLKNNGGFSSTRSPAQNLGLGDAKGLLIRLRGDGRTYNVNALNSDRRSEVRTWRKAFPTKAGQWEEVRVPFAEMKLSVMGQSFPNSPLTPADVRSIGFSVSDKTEAPFQLEIDWIRAY